jgi:hypothetical protein
MLTQLGFFRDSPRSLRASRATPDEGVRGYTSHCGVSGVTMKHVGTPAPLLRQISKFSGLT